MSIPSLRVFFRVSAYFVRGSDHARHRVTRLTEHSVIALRYHLRRTSSATLIVFDW